MRIEWTKVTRLSKLVALILFVTLPFIGFWYGIQFGELFAFLQMRGNGNGGVLSSTLPEYYTNPAEWQTFTAADGRFSIAYPIDFDAQAGLEGANFTLKIPRAFAPQSNFIEGILNIYSGGNNSEIQDCLRPSSTDNPVLATSTATIDGILFTVFHSADAAAGSYYETTSYRVLRGGRCYKVEHTLHSTQIDNYPPEYHLKPFDKARALELLDRIVGTFKFH